MRRTSWPIHALLALSLLFRTPLHADETTLAVVSAGVQQADDGAFVSADYKFMPGEPLYVTFEMAGFHVKAEEEKSVRNISLTWEVSALDGSNVPLAPPESGEIKTELSPEDKKWSPKRRVTFQLPQLTPAGQFHIHIAVKDLLGNTEASKDVPFRIGGTTLEVSENITVEHIRFSREEDGQPLELAAFRPGDTVFARFEIVGFSSGPEREYHVSYGLTVLRPDGKVYLDVPSAADLKDSPFYPAKFLPGRVEIVTTPSSGRGTYVLVLTTRDLTSDKTFVTRRSFSLE